MPMLFLSIKLGFVRKFFAVGKGLCNPEEAIASFDFYVEDVNECEVKNGGCDQVCEDNDGSFTCSCNDGYSLMPDDSSCARKIVVPTIGHCSILAHKYLFKN